MVTGNKLLAMQTVQNIRSLPADQMREASHAVPLLLRIECATYIRQCEKRRVFPTLAEAMAQGPAYECDYCGKAHTIPVDQDIDERE